MLEPDFIARTCLDGVFLDLRLSPRGTGVRELVLKDDRDLWDEIFEGAFVNRMKDIVDFGFKDLSKANKCEGMLFMQLWLIQEHAMIFEVYLKKHSTGGGVWFLEA
ncbi:conserved oligomeric Golgi complex subunit 1-like protein [Cinnamomum micranthum f. kanehirae]|uniref:Conserved oligomeric Golgi complex subunit 1 n=1 Tax=Cinnamomum micranthum f. kanehirae TaxID=337451 RepID=A0A3S3NP06_9MAGN|nr:conserved oligomeric Golgi complex subunit 1-like protein [Cinnamomum micranthum f. kanehirae]